MTRKRYHKLLIATSHCFHTDKANHPDFNIATALRGIPEIKSSTDSSISYQVCWDTIYKVSNLGKYGLPTK
jgi:hypothetical protein